MRKINPTPEYSRENEAAFRDLLAREQAVTFKKTEDVIIDTRLILMSANGTAYQIVVSNAGALSTVAV